MLATAARRPAAALVTAGRRCPAVRRPARRPVPATVARVYPVDDLAPPPARRVAVGPRLRFTPAPASSAKALVILFGWLGARDRDVAKYEAVWGRLAHPTLVARPSVAASLVPWSVDAAADAVARAAAAAAAGRCGAAATAAPTRIIAHVFSNAGFLLAGTLLSRHGAALRVAGALFDSCPARVDADMAARGIVAAVAGEPATGVTGRHPLAVAAARPPLRALLGAPPVARRLDAAWRVWGGGAGGGGALRPDAPVAFAYAEDDALIPAPAVRAFAAAAAAARVGVTGAAPVVVRAFDSPHCEHLRLHPEEYEAMVADFAAAVGGGEEVDTDT